jgi:hypothetical protein
VQDFIPAPMDVATAMYYTGLDPFTKKPVYTAKKLRDRKMQRALMQFFKPENYFEVREALLEAGRGDLIGDGCDALSPTRLRRRRLRRALPRTTSAAAHERGRRRRFTRPSLRSVGAPGLGRVHWVPRQGAGAARRSSAAAAGRAEALRGLPPAPPGRAVAPHPRHATKRDRKSAGSIGHDSFGRANNR